MRYRYLDDFPRGISVFAIFFFYGIAVLGNPMSPSMNVLASALHFTHLGAKSFMT